MSCRLFRTTRSLRRAAATQAVAQTAQVVSHPDPLTPAPADEALAPAKSFPEVASQRAIFDWTKSHLHECKQPFNVTNAGTIAALPTNQRMEGAVPEVAAFTTAMGVPNALVHGPEGTTAEHEVSAIQALSNLRRKHDWELSKMMMQNALAHTEALETMAQLMRVRQEQARVQQEKAEEAMRVQQEKAQEAMRVQQEKAQEAMRVQQVEAQEAMRVQKEKAQEAMRVQQEKAQEAMRVQQEEARVQQVEARIQQVEARIRQEQARARYEEARDAMLVRQHEARQATTALAVTVLRPLVALVSRQFTEHFAKNPQADVPAGLKDFGKVEMADLSRQFHCHRRVFARFHTEAQVVHAHPVMSWDEMIRFVNIEPSEFERALRLAIEHSSQDPEVVHFLTCLFEAMKKYPTIVVPRLETGG